MVKTNKNRADFATQDTSEYATPTIQDRSRMKMTANTSLARDDTTNDASIMEWSTITKQLNAAYSFL